MQYSYSGGGYNDTQNTADIATNAADIVNLQAEDVLIEAFDAKARKGLLSGKNSFHFDGVSCLLSDGLRDELTDVLNIAGSIELVFKAEALPAAGFESTIVTISGMGPATYLTIAVDENGHILCEANSATVDQWTVLSTAALVVVGEWNHLVLTQDGATLTLYFNGVAAANAQVVTTVGYWLGDLGAGGEFLVGIPVAAHVAGAPFVGEVNRIRCYTNVLSATEVGDCFVGELPVMRVGARIENRIENNNPGLWAGVNDIAMGAAAADLINYTWSGHFVSTATQLNASLLFPFRSGRRYRINYFVTETVAPDGDFNMYLPAGLTAADVNLPFTAGAHSVEFDVVDGAEAMDFVFATVDTTATQGTLVIGNVLISEMGCLASLTDKGIMTRGYWLDEMQVGYHNKEMNMIGDIGGFATNLPMIREFPNKIKLVFKNIMADGGVVDVMADGYRVESIIARNITVNAVTFNILFDAVSTVALEASAGNDILETTLVTTLPGPTDDPNNPSDFNYTSALWNAGELEVTVIASRYN